MLPFTLEQFLNVFATYNKAIWPAQIATYVLGTIAVAALLRPGRASDRVVSAVLGLMWLCTGVLYHGVFFSSINKAAFALGALFVVECVALLYAGIVRDALRFAINYGFRAVIGAGFILYASLVYPLIGIATGHSWPALPMFGVAPSPVTIFTFGSTYDDPPLLLLASSDPLHLVTHRRQRCYPPRRSTGLATFG